MSKEIEIMKAFIYEFCPFYDNLDEFTYEELKGIIKRIAIEL